MSIEAGRLEYNCQSPWIWVGKGGGGQLVEGGVVKMKALLELSHAKLKRRTLLFQIALTQNLFSSRAMKAFDCLDYVIKWSSLPVVF